jgi:hypothetical protein
MSGERYLFDFECLTYPTEDNSDLELALWDLARPLEPSSPTLASDEIRVIASEAREEILHLKRRLRDAAQSLVALAKDIDDDS